MKTALLILLLPISVFAQKSKKDSVKIDSNEVKTLQRNSLIIQQYIHRLHIDATQRDQLDSVYNVSAAIFEKSLKKKKQK